MQCDSPKVIPNKNRTPTNDEPFIAVRCGQCEACVTAYTRQWYVRLKIESNKAYSSTFVTLTYAIAPLTENCWETLVPKHVDQYINSLRHLEAVRKPIGKPLKNGKKRMKKVWNTELKFYLTAEYGGETDRPHYHLVIFNLRQKYNAVKAWKYGHAQQSNILDARINYVIQHHFKRKGIPIQYNDDREKEFTRISRGIGESYVKLAGYKHIKDETGTINLGGKTYVLPRYLKNKIFPPYKARHLTDDGKEITKTRQHPVSKRIGKKNLHHFFKKQQKDIQNHEHGLSGYLKAINEHKAVRNSRNQNKNSKL